MIAHTGNSGRVGMRYQRHEEVVSTPLCAYGPLNRTWRTLDALKADAPWHAYLKGVYQELPSAFPFSLASLAFFRRDLLPEPVLAMPTTSRPLWRR